LSPLFLNKCTLSEALEVRINLEMCHAGIVTLKKPKFRNVLITLPKADENFTEMNSYEVLLV